MNLLETPPHEEPQTAIDRLLAEQRLLTPVARFSREHDEGTLPSKARYYRNLIPLSLPKPGEQYAFEVDMDKCSGCKACVTACHNLNGLDDEETWRSVGFLYGGTGSRPYQQTITTACHHCVNPECLNGCPVLAYDKDPITGIVRHLDDQCIGCQYCVLKCPYEVPKYNERKGIVRKCDMCSNRLEDGEAPACVQACPTQAIRIRIVDQAEVAKTTTRTSTLVAGAPLSHYTVPTTTYITTRETPANTCAADNTTPRVEAPHWPLVGMLLLTQMSVGLFSVDLVESKLLAPGFYDRISTVQTVIAITLALLGLGTSVLHLGRPLQSWRVFLGLRKSWLSREIVIFGMFGGLLTAAAASLAAKLGVLPFPGAIQPVLTSATTITLLKSAIVLSGLVGVFCSAMIYIDTPRVMWRTPRTGVKFFGTALVSGAAISLFCVNAAFNSVTAPDQLAAFNAALALGLILSMAIKMGSEFSITKHFSDDETSPLYRAFILLDGPLGKKLRSRLGLGWVGGIIAPLVLMFSSLNSHNSIDTSTALLCCTLALFACIAGEILERHLFFVASTGPKMPGGVSA